jgi:hypothetical protein
VGSGSYSILSYLLAGSFCCLLFVVLGLELRAYTLNHSTSRIFVKGL